MLNVLLKPYTEKQRADFVVKNNHNNGLRIEETETALYALHDYELLQNGEVVDLRNDEAYLQNCLDKAKQKAKLSINKSY